MTGQLSLGDALAERGMAQVAAASGDWETSSLDRLIASFAASRRPFSVNSLRDLVPDSRKNLIGARFRAAANAGLIRPLGFVRSDLPSTRGAYVREWIGARQ